MTPIPPNRASMIAMRDSVTVSIAADRIGMASRMFGVIWVAVLTSRGNTSE